MTKWAHADVLDNGIAHIKANATKQILVSTYAAGDSYATIQTNKLAEANMASGDYTIASNGNNRRLTTASGKSGTASAGAAAGANLHIAFTNGVDQVLWVTDETTDQAITAGNPVNFPPLTYDANQPT